MTAFAFYLLKVIICSGILFLYYYLALRNKLFHQWNRFYLLAAIIISFIAPIVQITIMHKADEPAKAIQMLQVFESAGGYLEEVTISGSPSISIDQWLMMGYAVISAVFLITVLLSFKKIISILKSHTVQWIEKIKFVNTKVQGTPFSFFNVIFWNEDIDLQTETGQQIFEHELVHVKEKHTIDKLFVQLVLVVFWCNPFFWLIRRELKLIHEFIADKKAVGEHGTAALASMILSSSYPSHFNSLTNQFFQTSIKRRIAMLAKIQNPKINYISRILALPILALTILAFSLKTKNLVSSSVKLEKEIVVVIDAGHGLMPDRRHSGATVDNIYEDEINLAITNKIKELNANDKIKIVLTRPIQQIIDLTKRVEIARENHADLFVSIHVNAIPPSTNSSQGFSKGFEVLISGEQNLFQQQSVLFASALQKELSSVHLTNPSVVQKKAAIWVLDHNVCPSVLVECGYLSDKEDRNFITNENNQEKVAQKILQAIETYAANQKAQVNTTLKELTNSSTNFIQTASENPRKKNIDSTPLYLVNGKEVSKAEADLIAPSDIESVSVLKGDNAIAVYGKKGRNGVIEIKLKKAQNTPLYVLDGKYVSKEEFEKITDPALIESINILKSKSATDKYGGKGRNGVIEIKLKATKNDEGIIIKNNGEAGVR